ncbi:MAG TPA: hypothetical protein VMT20_06880 [Terriglobia bacterium]|nr:hypothetical protein [Terriglobia bacterium]
MKAKPKPSGRHRALSTEQGVEALQVTLGEAVEVCEELLALSMRLKRLRPGGEAYLDQLPRVSVCATVLNAKTDSIEREIDDIIDTLPD